MVCLVTGDRWWSDYQFILSTVREWHKYVTITLLVHGACRGADLMGERAAEYIGIPTAVHPANWDRDGLAAGPIRNRQMLIEHPDIELVLGFHDNIRVSKGTKDMMLVASNRGILCSLESHEETVCPWSKNNLIAA
jgi:SLOG family YspA-like protein